MMDERARKRIAGPSWDQIRGTIEEIDAVLHRSSPTVHGELTTIYVKYTADETGSQPFAVVWIKKSSQVIVGLSLPDGIAHPLLCDPDKNMKYNGLTKFLTIQSGAALPEQFASWCQSAFDHARLVV